MMKAQTETTPLGVIDSLNAGFSAVARKPGLLLIPLLLDLFLWIGPRLSITPVVADLAARLQKITGGTADSSAALFEQSMSEILGSYNMFSALSTWPLGTPSLLAGNDLEAGPLGTLVTIQVQALDELLAWLLSLTLAGLLIGSLYLGLIARWTGGDHVPLRTWARFTWIHWARIVALVFVVLLGAFCLSVSFFLAVEIIAMIFAPLASLLLVGGIGIAMWGLFHLFFAAHGILLEGLSVSQAIGNSVTLVRQYRFSSVGLLVITVIISLGLGTIWHIPPTKSWMRLVAIAGNAFINTGLAAATFVFYRERTTRLAAALPKAKQTTNSER